jgi:hypothetical protein
MAPSPQAAAIPVITTTEEFKAYYLSYVQALHIDLNAVARFLSPELILNGEVMAPLELVNIIRPGSTFGITMLVAELSERTIAVRMVIDVPVPSTTGLGLEEPYEPTLVGEDSIQEHVFYRFNDQWLIEEIWSIYRSPDFPPIVRQVKNNHPNAPLPVQSPLNSHLLPSLTVPSPPTALFDFGSVYASKVRRNDDAHAFNSSFDPRQLPTTLV